MYGAQHDARAGTETCPYAGVRYHPLVWDGAAGNTLYREPEDRGHPRPARRIGVTVGFAAWALQVTADGGERGVAWT